MGALCVPPVVKTAPPCCGTSTRASVFIPWTRMILSTLLFSHQTATGCVLPPAVPSRSGILTKDLVETLEVPVDPTKGGGVPYCISLCWSSDGSNLYAGYTDNVIRVWHV